MATATVSDSSLAYARIGPAIHFLVEHAEEQPTLPETAAVTGLSPQHFQRVFQRSVGISPKRFLQHLTVQAAQALLARSSTVLDATYGAGLSGPGRLHDHFVTLEALTPGEWRARGTRTVIRWGVAPSPLGECLVAWTERGICRIGFTDRAHSGPLADLRSALPDASYVEDAAGGARVVARVFDPARDADELRMFVRGTNFQMQVWRALLRVPEGAALSYQQLACSIGRPSATRAVASAVARNPVAVLIPCHRVLRKSGALGGYRWGRDRKRALLALEAGRGDG
jgi:AraC family transcriptional regulator of adaptative response/methylated-DNA-[protein]-cysteine methyltransferase